VEGFDFFVGGGLGHASGVARRVGYRAPANAVAPALERLFVGYMSRREDDESFRAWTTRVGDDAVRHVLTGALSPASAAAESVA
jgi:sulfite reductase beta subunit-like hemoprotein